MNYGYARVSTKMQQSDGNSLEIQERTLLEAGAQIIYMDSYSGTSMERPRFNELRTLLRPHDTLIVTKLDRFARSVSQGILVIDELLEKQVTVNVLNMGIMDNSPTGKLIRNILLSFAEFERDMIVERTQEGRRISGKYGGRPRKYSDTELTNALLLLQSHTYQEVSMMTGISVSTLYRVKIQY